MREKRYDRARRCANSFKSALVQHYFARNIRTVPAGAAKCAMALLNDARLIKARPLMVGATWRWPAVEGVVRTAKDLPQPLLWPTARG